MKEIVIAAHTLDLLVRELGGDCEQGASLYLKFDVSGERWLVHAWEIASSDDVVSASSIEITFAPQFLTRCSRRARDSGCALALLHTHPSGANCFSPVDDETEKKLAQFMDTRSCGRPTFSLVLCDGALLARLFGSQNYVTVRVVGKNVEVFGGARLGNTDLSRQYDRQVQAFGKEGQDVLSRLTVAIVGLGGTGSVLAQQLAHLGVQDFILLDPDTVEDTNLNRVVGTSPNSVGASKVDVSRALITSINPSARVITQSETVISNAGRRLLCRSHAIFMCTDSHSSRAFLSELCHQYLIPGFDIGVSINATAGVVKAITGRAQMVVPGTPCLLCSNVLDPRRIREELMTPEQRAADPYFNEGAVTQPAVISLNSTVVSLAVTMFLSAFTGIPMRSRWISFDGIVSTTRTLATSPDEECAVCGSDGVTALGDERKLTFLS
jgi:molybdopterin/thiamine biosynthesis adenylyltransferase